MIDNLVSIITPCYNGSKFISQTIDSVLAQTYPHWEMIIVDDGSKDNSAEIIREYTQKDQRIKLIQQPNGGSANARNNGIRNAQGRYIALLDADDLWEPAFLEKQLALMHEHGVSLVYGSYRLIDENSQEILKPMMCKPKITLKNMMVTCYIGCLTGLYDTKEHGKVYLHEELRSIRDDYAYWIDIMRMCQVAYGNQELLARYRVLSNSVTGNKKKLIKHQYKFYRNYLHLGPIRSCMNLVVWGVRGLRIFNGI